MSTQGNAPENMVKHTTNQISPIRLPGSCTVTKGLTWPRESTGQPIRVTSKQYQRTMSVSRRLQKHVSNQGGKKTSEVVSSSIDVGFHEILADFHRFPSIIEETCWKPRHQAIPRSNSLAPRALPWSSLVPWDLFSPPATWNGGHKWGWWAQHMYSIYI